MPPKFYLTLTMALMFPTVAGACSVLPEDEEIRASKEEETEVSASVRELWNEADVVIVGRVLSTSEDRQRAEDVYPPDANGNVRGGAVVAGKVSIEPLRELKGLAANPLSATYFRDESVIEVGCRSVLYFRTVGYLMPTYRYLLYLRQGEILRANQVVDWFDELDVSEEMRMLQVNPGTTAR